MYGASADVHVRAIERPSRILIEWGEPPTTVEWRFTSLGAEATLVRISNTGFRGTEEEVVDTAYVYGPIRSRYAMLGFRYGVSC